MCPHVRGTKNGKSHALSYQSGGESNGRPIRVDCSPENWRCIDIDALMNVEIIGIEKWHTAPDDSRPRKCIDFVDCQSS
jgi:hypothetical protein